MKLQAPFNSDNLHWYWYCNIEMGVGRVERALNLPVKYRFICYNPSAKLDFCEVAILPVRSMLRTRPFSLYTTQTELTQNTTVYICAAALNLLCWILEGRGWKDAHEKNQRTVLLRILRRSDYKYWRTLGRRKKDQCGNLRALSIWGWADRCAGTPPSSPTGARPASTTSALFA